jgi:hypothetical protein
MTSYYIERSKDRPCDFFLEFQKKQPVLVLLFFFLVFKKHCFQQFFY